MVNVNVSKNNIDLLTLCLVLILITSFSFFLHNFGSISAPDMPVICEADLIRVSGTEVVMSE